MGDLRCPICGKIATASHIQNLDKWYIECDVKFQGGCRMQGPRMDTREEAVDGWNRLRYMAPEKRKMTVWLVQAPSKNEYVTSEDLSLCMRDEGYTVISSAEVEFTII